MSEVTFQRTSLRHAVSLSEPQWAAVVQALRDEKLRRRDGKAPRPYDQLVPGVSTRQVQYVVDRTRSRGEASLGVGRRWLSEQPDAVEPEARQLHEQGLTYRQIGRRLGVSPMTARRHAQHRMNGPR